MNNPITDAPEAIRRILCPFSPAERIQIIEKALAKLALQESEDEEDDFYEEPAFFEPYTGLEAHPWES